MEILPLPSRTAEARRWKSMKGIKSGRVFFSIFHLPIMMMPKMNGQVVLVQLEIKVRQNE